MIPHTLCVPHAYRYRFEAGPSPADAFFLAIDSYPMEKEAPKSMMRRLADSIGISRLHAHLLRHTYATQFQIHPIPDRSYAVGFRE